jgi:hypothetical protein
LADLVCNSSGFGFNGYDVDSGDAKLDLLENFKMKNVEVSPLRSKGVIL